ncbi:MAG TPA: HAD-IA family hydrolase [Chitinispirillaceae bacterium]|nr:HAD-IA family hydrolase [Chitinispirillaceae bacterium]
MDTGKKSTVIFDFDGTLADTMQLILDIYNEVLVPSFKCKQIKKMDVEKFREFHPKELLELHNIPLIKLPFIVLRARSEMNRRISDIHLQPGIKYAVKTLYDSGTRLGICTSNSKVNVMSFLSQNSMTEWFEFIYSSKHLFGKDRVLRRIIHEQKLSKDEKTIFIGDEARDIDAARSAGIRVASVTWGLNSKSMLEQKKPDILLDSPEELLNLI